MHIYKKQIVDAEGNFRVYQVYDTGRKRIVANDRPDYIKWIASGNVPETIPYTPPPPQEPLPIEALRAQKIQSISGAFAEALTQGCPIRLPDGREFRIDCEPKNQADFTALLIELQAFGIQQTNVRGYDNITRTLSAEEGILMCGQMFQYVQSLMNKKWTLIDTAVNAKSAEALAEIVW